MESIDILLLGFVYFYVILIFIISEKVLNSKDNISRKFIHIMVGNMIFIMPFFTDPTIMVYYLTLPITIGAFLISDYSPIKINNAVSNAGHGLGLVYYAGVWTLLIFVFGHNLWIVALAMAPMVYGDGFASLIGEKYGKHKFSLTKDIKSLEGSLGMLIITILTSSLIWIFYSFLNYPIGAFNIAIILVISLIATISEALSSKGLDNLIVPLICSCLYYLATVVL
ncbi:diacylglycerol/polyprenol kinase family protein [Methanobrevibacter sp. DSM 116169]|uniref:diacylglycerol/polyprenol kinase family protein n=1 Tax=Methanobrevibacter sp. DSM 116169 TaxID=3242727 RepID=UPI0038FC6D25